MEYKSRDSKMDMKSLKTYNKLKYELPSNLNVVERRCNKVSFADQNSYSSTSGNEVVIRLTASTDYVYGPNSYLVFDLTGASANDSLGFRKDTAMDLFSRVLFEDRSGAELERNDKLNSYCAQVLPWHHSSAYKGTGCAMAGQLESGERATETAGSSVLTAAAPVFLDNGIIADYDIKSLVPLTVCIPLRMFLGVFDRETLIPSMLISGSLIRLRMEAVSTALVAISGTTDTVATSYTISNPRVILDSMSLAPVVQKNLMEQSQASGGLDFTYTTAYYQSGNPGTNVDFNLQVNKAVSRCQKLYWSAHAQATPADIKHESFGTALMAMSQLDYRLGDLYFPQRVIAIASGGTAGKSGAEFYQNSLQSVQRMRTTRDPPSITKQVFLKSGVALNATPATNNNSGRCVHVQSFEQSSALEYSGLAINNSRTLEARICFAAAGLTSQTIDAWITYVKLAKCNQLRTIIKE